jgi:2-polyprenyl-3-methyl-5-hydroxy-6-metoxy-1,4-benzoquinol methylase
MRGLLDPEGTHAAAVRSLADLRGLRVLEIGCGDGRLTHELAGDATSWLATDPKSDAVDEARRTLPEALADRVTFAVAGGADVEAPESEFDLVLFSWSL